LTPEGRADRFKMAAYTLKSYGEKFPDLA
jgi:hypothetical protein